MNGDAEAADAADDDDENYLINITSKVLTSEISVAMDNSSLRKVSISAFLLSATVRMLLRPITNLHTLLLFFIEGL